MKLFEGKTPAERNKIIAAIALGAISFLAIVYVFFGDSIFGSSKANTKPTPSPSKPKQTITAGPVQPSAGGDMPIDPADLTAIRYERLLPPEPSVGRNVFAFYVPPPPTPTPPPTPIPVKPPDFTISTLTPSNVFARTGDFTLQVSGDKFTPEARIVLDNAPLNTRFINAQTLQAVVSASMIANDGSRMVKVIADPGKVSNDATLVVAAPPKPNYDYVTLIGDRHYQNDVAMLKNKGGSKELISVHRGDILDRRFRITSISEAEVAVIDVTLNIKHSIPFHSDRGGAGRSSAGGGGADPNNDIRRFPGGRIPQSLQVPPDPNTSIPGIPDNIPRYQPPVQPNGKEDVDDEDDDGKP